MTRPSLFPSLALVAVLAFAPAALAAPAAPATFTSPSGTSLVVRASDADGKTFLSVGDVAAALGGTLSFEAATGSFELRIGPHTAVFGTETPIAVVDTKLVQLTSTVRGEGTDAFADAEFFTRVLSPLFGVTFAWDRASRTLAARRPEMREIGVESSVSAFEGTTKVVFRFTQAPAYKVERGDDQVVLRFPGVRLVPAVPEVAVDDPRVARLLLRPAELAVVLKGKNLSTNVFALSNPTSKSECTAEQAYAWSGGRALFASGSPFDPVVTGGRRYVPRQGNNSYIFPGVGLGVVSVQSSRVTDGMLMAAARTLAESVTAEDLAQGSLYPALSRIRDVSAQIAVSVGEVAFSEGLAGIDRPPDLLALMRQQMYDPNYVRYA